MKKIFVIIFIIVFSMGTMVGCNNNPTTSPPITNSDTSIDDSSSDDSSNTLTESELKSIALQALYDNLCLYINRSVFTNWNSDIDPSSCRYSIGSIKKDGSGYKVNGVCYFYDKYGNLVSKYWDGSGGYRISFTVNISSTGYASCYWDD